MKRAGLLLAAGTVACLAVGVRSARADQPRVVSLHDVTTEIVVALGATERLVGVAEPVDQPRATLAATARVPRVGDAESIVARAPTVVLGMATVGERSPELVRLLRARGTDVWLGDPHTLHDVLALVPAVAARVGEPAAGARLVQSLRAQMDLASSEPRPGRAFVRVFVYDCCDPAFTAGGRAVLSDLITRAGGTNVFADLAMGWGKVPWETVIARRPELIVIDDYAFGGQTDVPGKRARLGAIPSLAGVPTVVMPLGEALGGLRSVDGLRRLRAAISNAGLVHAQGKELAR
jgi:iron complex transport system substrate-binding protein